MWTNDKHKIHINNVHNLWENKNQESISKENDIAKNKISELKIKENI